MRPFAVGYVIWALFVADLCLEFVLAVEIFHGQMSNAMLAPIVLPYRRLTR